MTEAMSDPKATKDLRWNFSVNLFDVTFFMFAMSVISKETVLPVLVRHLTDSTLAIGLIPAIFSSGYHLPQIFSANYSERLRYKKPFVMLLGGLGERVPYAFMACMMAWVALPHPALALVLFFLLLATATCGGGFATPAWYDIIAKAIPVQRRGLWAGLSHGGGALIGVAGAAFVGHVLKDHPYPVNFAILFSVASVALALSWIGLALNRESPSPTLRPSRPFGQYVASLPGIVKRDGNYARYLIGRAVMELGSMAAGFYMVYGADRFGAGPERIALLTGVLVASEATLNLVWGLLGDRVGHKTVLMGAGFAMALASLVAFTAGSSRGLILTFALLGAYRAAGAVSSLNIILEFCDPEERPTYIGLTNTLLAPMLFLAPMIGGGLASWLGYREMFVVAAVSASAGGLLLALWVREPRRRALS